MSRWPNRIRSDQVPVALARKTHGVTGLSVVARVVNRAAGDVDVTAVRRIDSAGNSVKQLAAGDTDPLRLDQFQQRGSGGLTVGMLVENRAAGQRDVR